MYHWFHVYHTMFLKFWSNMTPGQYGYLLVGVGVVGVLLLKGSKR